MEWDDYLRQQAATYRQLAEKAETTPLKDAKALLSELKDLSGTQTRARRG